MFLIAFLLMQAVPPQIERGQALFLDEAKGCSTCHVLQGRGTAVGPDLKTVSQLSPRAMATAIRATLTAYVQKIKLKNGDTFPAMPPAQGGDAVAVFDLSKMPPAPRKFARADIESMTNNDIWKHPPAVRGYTAEQLADVIAYLRYAVSGRRQAVDPAEVE